VGQTDRIQVVQTDGEIKCYINKENKAVIQYTLGGVVVREDKFVKSASCGERRSEVAPNYCDFRGTQTDFNIPEI